MRKGVINLDWLDAEIEKTKNTLCTNSPIADDRVTLKVASEIILEVLFNCSTFYS